MDDRGAIPGVVGWHVQEGSFVLDNPISRRLAQQQSDATLKIATFGGAFDYVQMKYVASVFTARTGVKIELVNGNSRDHLAKLVASKGREPPLDIVFLDEDVQVQAIAAGVLSKMTRKRSTQPEIRLR